MSKTRTLTVCWECNPEWPFRRHAFGQNDLLYLLRRVIFTVGLPEITVRQVLTFIVFAFYENVRQVFYSLALDFKKNYFVC